MAPLVHYLLKDPVCSEFWTEKLKQRLRSTKDSSKDFSAQLQISADHFLRRSRAIDVELLLKALGKQFKKGAGWTAGGGYGSVESSSTGPEGLDSVWTA